MWIVNNLDFKMVEGDWGVELPITFEDITLTASDELKFVIKSASDGDVLVTKVFTNISENTINLALTESETALLPVGTYAYTLDWYQSGAFLCNLIPCGIFRVVNKA